MKWGRKKSTSSSTHYQSLISRVFPVSWLVNFKQNGATFELNSRTRKQKIKDTTSNMVSPRKSAYMNRESRTKANKSSRVKVCYSRTDHQCKIRALEDMKKARTRSKKKKKKNRGVERNRVFDSYAVVKCSFAPERDFRNSMVEMIREKRIRRPDELEELLTCYLKLNCDKYHDIIIKVFQQVWLFEMNKEFIDLQMGNNDHLSFQ